MFFLYKDSVKVLFICKSMYFQEGTMIQNYFINNNNVSQNAWSTVHVKYLI